MIDQKIQFSKAERFRAQHLDEKLLILPNIWDALGAKLLQQADVLVIDVGRTRAAFRSA